MIIKQFTKFLYPFKFVKDDPQSRITETIISSKGNDISIWERCGIDGHELRDGIADLYSEREDCPRRVADCFKLNINCRTLLNLPKKSQDLLTFVSRGNTERNYSIAITDIRLYLFESEVGFAEISCEYQNQNLDDYLDTNYFISEIKSDKNYFKVNKNKNVDNGQDYIFSVKDILKLIISFVGDKIEFFDSAGRELIDKKPIIFSYLLLDKKPDDLQTILFLARKNYKDTYKYPQSEYNIYDNPYVYQTFENSYWATSQNGIVNVSHLVNNEKTNIFFINNFADKICKSYFHLFLCVLHQKYAIRLLSSKMGNLCLIGKVYKNIKKKIRLINDYQSQDSYIALKQKLKHAQNYQDMAISLKLRIFFRNPSNIEHINKYYNIISNTFEIESIYNEFNEDINCVVKIGNDCITKIKDLEDSKQILKKARVGPFLAIFGPLIAFAALFNSSWSTIESIFGESMSFLFGHRMTSVLAFILLIGIAVVFILAISTIIISIYGILIENNLIKKNLKEAEENLLEIE